MVKRILFASLIWDHKRGGGQMKTASLFLYADGNISARHDSPFRAPSLDTDTYFPPKRNCYDNQPKKYAITC
jgi:hypothetical protein